MTTIYAISVRGIGHLVFLLPILICFSFSLRGQSTDIDFRQYKAVDGLPENIIRCIYQDRQGFIWVATVNGLAKYDGGSFTVYKPQEGDPHSIRGRIITSFLETTDGQLWVGTEAGLNRLDPQTGRFTFFEVDKGPFSSNLPKVHSLLEDFQGHIWGVSYEDQSLMKLDPSTGEVIRFEHDPDDIFSIGHDRVMVNDWNWNPKAALAKGSKGDIWIGLEGGKGLDRYDPLTGRFTHYRHWPGRPAGLSNDTITALYSDCEGTLWIGTMDGLNAYDQESGKFRVFRSDHRSEKHFNTNRIFDINEDRAGNLWLSKWFVLDKFDKTTQRFTQYWNEYLPGAVMNNNQSAIWIGENPQGQIAFWSLDELRVLLYEKEEDAITKHFHPEEQTNRIELVHGIVDRSGILWLGSPTGLFKEKQTSYRFTNHRNEEIFGVSETGIRHFYEQQNGLLWIGARNGLLRVDLESDKKILFRNNQTNRKALHGFSVNDIVEDDQGGLWIATGGGGINKLSNAADKSYTRNLAEGQPIRASSIQNNSHLPEYAVDGNPSTRWSSSFADPQWIMVDLGRRCHIGRIRLNWEFAAAAAYTIEVSDDGRHWKTVYRETSGRIGGGEEIINLTAEGRFVKLSGTARTTPYGYSLWDFEVYGPLPAFTHYKANAADPTSLLSDFAYDIHKDQAGNLWVANFGGLSRYDRELDGFVNYQFANLGFPLENNANAVYQIAEDAAGRLWLESGSGLLRFDPRSETFTQYKHDPADPTSLSGDHVSQLYSDREGNIWIACDLAGLNLYNPSSGDFTRYLADNVVVSFLEDSKGRFWLGTVLQGLYNINRETGAVAHFTEEDGLIYDRIEHLQEDDQGYIWIATLRGLSRLDPDSKDFENYDEKDGLLMNNFIEAGFKDSKGRIYIAGTEGFNIFDANQATVETSAPPVRITTLKVKSNNLQNGSNYEPLSKLLFDTETIDLAHHQNSLYLEFAALHYANPEKNQFAVKLEPLAESWDYLDNRQSIFYPGLAPGKYTFRVKAANAFGVWNEEGALLNLIIHPPWWKSTWAYILYVILFFTLIYYIRRNELHKQKNQLTRERRVNEQLRRLDTLKDQFLANTSHELRTPLNGIIGLADSLIDGATGELPEPTKSNLRMISASGRRLANLVNDLLDFSKLKNKELTLHRKPTDLYILTEIVLNISRPLVRNKDLELVNGILRDVPLVDADDNRIQQVMHNLIGNAIKFTEQGTVRVSAEVQNGQLAISVSDTGIGIARTHHKQIFQSFEQGDPDCYKGDAREYGGTGLGLAVTKQLVELHGGEIQVESEEGQGSVFTFTLPLSTVERAEQLTEIVAPVTSSTPRVLERLVDDQPGEIRFSRQVGSSIENGSGHKDDLNLLLPLTPSRGERFRILAVDDEPVNLQVLQNHLSLHHYEVTQASNGMQALRLLQRGERFNLVILDLMMPKMSGYEVCREIRKTFHSTELPVIMLTAKNQLVDLMEGFNAGANDYLTKPFSKEELLTRIRTHIELANVNQAYGRFVPHNFLKLLNRKSILDLKLGDHTAAHMTVLFADIRGYTTLSEEMSPGENFRFINAYLGRVGPIIEHNEGFISQYYGDGIMALFPQHPRHALQAAIQMQREVARYNQSRRRKGRRPVTIGIGLHTGELMLGVIGDTRRNDTGVISDAVNTASRMEGLTKIFGASIILSDETMEEIDHLDQFEYRFLGKVQVKGKAQAIGIFEFLDGDRPGLRRLKQQTRPLFEKALGHYFDQQFERAIAGFEKVLKRDPADLAAAYYRNSAAGYLRRGVAADWNGVERIEGK